jgi:hypothetical protein
MRPDPISLIANLNQNFQLFRAEDKVITVDMTGYDLANVIALEWRMAWSAFSIDDPLETFVKKSQSAGIMVAGTSIEITIDGIDTAILKPELYYHELKITLADGTVKVAMTGNVTLRMSLNIEGAPR